MTNVVHSRMQSFPLCDKLFNIFTFEFVQPSQMLNAPENAQLIYCHV